MKTITMFGAHERENLGRINVLEGAVRALAGGQPLSPVAQAAVDAAQTPTADATPLYEETLRDVGQLLGLTDEAIAGPSGRDALLAAAKKSRLAENLSEAITRANVDPGLARAVVDLADVDVTADADSIAGALDAALAEAIKRHPAIKRPTFAARSIAEFPAGSGGLPPQITREALSWMSPEQINAARKAGLLTHLDVGSG
jgi:hypothetical protein